MNEQLKILMCYYKSNIFLPKNSIYYPIQCGKAATHLDLGMQSDDVGDNISVRNRYWSEITGLYWAWKHFNKIDYIGLCSYRRFFNFVHNPISLLKILPVRDYSKIDEISIPDLDKIFNKYDIVVPKPYTYAYSIRNVCRMNYNQEDFEMLEKVIHKLHPDYDHAFKSFFYYGNKGFGHNMFILSWDNFNKYCEWVFSILFEMEKLINPINYPVNKVRVYGYMHEVLLSLYIYKNNLKPYYSQLVWVTDEIKYSQFNKMSYLVASKLSFFFNRPRRSF